MIELFKLNHSLSFPSVDFALDSPNGLLAFGGDLSVNRLIAAYKNGIFPWYSENEPILWWSPDPRGVIYATNCKANRSLKRSIRKFGYHCTLNQQFDSVINKCATVPRKDMRGSEESTSGTWITQEMIEAYQALHEAGYAHSVEVYDHQNELKGGLYGVVVNGIFCGESMFHEQTDASKVAFYALSQHMLRNGMNMIDCQLVNPHLESLGCIEMSRAEFLRQITLNQRWIDCWKTQALVLDV